MKRDVAYEPFAKLSELEPEAETGGKRTFRKILDLNLQPEILILMEKRKTIYLIDGSSYIHRAYHAIRGLSNSKGLPTNAVFGFTRMILKLIEDRTPDYAAVLLDAKGPTFRHKIYEGYKANRPPMPDDMSIQLPYIREVIEGFNLPVIEMQGYEADDLIGTLAHQAETAGFSVVMVTGDKDFMQLVTGQSIIWDPMKEKTVDRQAIKESVGLEPHQVIDMMGLAGDSSDNIPGVPGIGQKTAVGLIETFGSLENLYEQVDKMTRQDFSTCLRSWNSGSCSSLFQG
jgi:DNA polymerase-1